MLYWARRVSEDNVPPWEGVKSRAENQLNLSFHQQALIAEHSQQMNSITLWGSWEGNLAQTGKTPISQMVK